MVIVLMGCGGGWCLCSRPISMATWQEMSCKVEAAEAAVQKNIIEKTYVERIKAITKNGVCRKGGPKPGTGAQVRSVGCHMVELAL